MKKKLYTTRPWSFYSALSAFAIALTACKSAEFTGGRQRSEESKPVTAQQQNRPSASEESDDAPVISTGDETTQGTPSTAVPPAEDRRQPYAYDPITDKLGEPGWAGENVSPKIKSIFDTNQSVPLSQGSGCNRPTPNNPDSPDTPNATSTSDSNIPGNSPVESGGDSASVPSWDSGDDGAFWVPCQSDPASGEAKGSITGRKGAVIRVSGEFCPSRTFSQLSVLFVVDFSGSMTGPLEGPNDPIIGGSCGRLRAAQALAKQFSEFRDVDLSFGVVGFSNNARLRLGFTSLTNLQASLTTNNWCGSDSSTARTNYRAAFETANEALNNRNVAKVIYFISDGSPTVGGNDGLSDAQAGLSAAQTLRTNYGRDLVLNAVFLGYRNGDAQNPQGYLEKITGNPASVRLVSSADELVAAVTSFPITQDLIFAADVAGSVKVGDQVSKIQISNFKRRLPAHRYAYVSQPITLTGTPDSKTSHIVTFEAKTIDGKKIISRAQIDYVVVE